MNSDRQTRTEEALAMLEAPAGRGTSVGHPRETRPAIHGKMSTVIGKSGRRRLSGVVGKCKSGWVRLRPWLPGSIIVIGLAAAVWAIIRVHSAARFSPDAWPSSIEAVTTAALALITSWYVYLTFKLLDAQRTGPRVAAWETALRDLSLYIARKRQVMWAASEFFPIGLTGGTPPDLLKLIASRDALGELYGHLLEVLDLLPKRFAKQALGVAIHLVEAESEINALALAMIDEMQLRRRKLRRTWSWGGVRKAHEAADDPERSEPWADIIEGRHVRAAEESWEQFSSDVAEHLRS